MFDVPNYGTETSSMAEWYFVARGNAGLSDCREHLKTELNIPDGKHFPQEERLLAEPTLKEQMRVPTEPSAFKSRGWDAANSKLAAIGTDPLVLVEFIGARLYTGPCYRKYNSVLRGVSGQVPFLLEAWKELCSGNKYETTLHVISAAISKLCKIQTANMLFRAPGGALPQQFLQKNDFNVMGGVELAFMSCTTSRDVALDYAVTSNASVLFQIQEGYVDRGADLSWLSQYPHEKEITFPPLTTLEVKSKQVDGSVLVVNLVPRLPSSSLKQQVSTKGSRACSIM
uniref:Mono(ADP-ribosyl)transferase n=1 Tax=Haptolina ericina TaxID=156174 RepID=A0A7S3AUF5_9EUKA